MLYVSDLELRLCFRILDRKAGAGGWGLGATGIEDKRSSAIFVHLCIIHFLPDCQGVYPQCFNERFFGVYTSIYRPIGITNVNRDKMQDRI